MDGVTRGTWLVTGASRGLGRALVRAFAARGDRVLALARDERDLAALAGECAPGAVTPLPLDLADAARIGPAVRAAVDAAGTLDGVIHNAGIGRYAPFAAHAESELLAVLQVNLGAVMQICHALLPRLRAQRRGHIVAIGSDLARRPLANMAAYVASKHGLAGFLHSLLREVKDEGIRVSLINPGIIDTGFGGGREGDRAGPGALDPAALAALVLAVVDQPDGVLIDELTVHPPGQATF